MSYRVFSIRVLRLLFLKALGFTGVVPCLLISLGVYVYLCYCISNIRLILFEKLLPYIFYYSYFLFREVYLLYGPYTVVL